MHFVTVAGFETGAERLFSLGEERPVLWDNTIEGYKLTPRS
jgi:hypothetical protein